MTQSRVALRLQAILIRFITGIYSILDLYFSKPQPQQPAFKEKISSTTSPQRGSIELLFYTPASSPNDGPKPVVINFHGGGFVFGNPQMDARWADAVTKSGIVCVSVGYRRAPEHPFPTPIDDCVDAVEWLYEHAGAFNLDTTKFVLSGFSAGGTAVFSSALKLRSEVDKKISLAGIISFYPSVDRTQTPATRLATNPASAGKSSLPESWRVLFDESYVFPPSVDKSSPYLSPALASDNVLQSNLPQKIAIFTCGFDDLLHEAETFRQRLQSLGKEVMGSTIKDVGHAWDRMPKYRKGDTKRDQMYFEAVTCLKSMYA